MDEGRRMASPADNRLSAYNSPGKKVKRKKGGEKGKRQQKAGGMT